MPKISSVLVFFKILSGILNYFLSNFQCLDFCLDLNSFPLIQILSPMTRGSLGTISLNTVIQEVSNPYARGKRQLKIGERIFRVGDRVIHRRNNYDLDVFNGDIGVIRDIDTKDLTCSIAFYPDNRLVHYQQNDIVELDLASAITIHKSQGSELEIVIIPVLTQHFKMLFRNLIYTGKIRAKNWLSLLAQEEPLPWQLKTRISVRDRLLCRNC